MDMIEALRTADVELADAQLRRDLVLEALALSDLAPAKVKGRWRVTTREYFGVEIRVDRIWLAKHQGIWDLEPVYYWFIRGRAYKQNGKLGRRLVTTHTLFEEGR